MSTSRTKRKYYTYKTLIAHKTPTKRFKVASQPPPIEALMRK